MLVNGTRANVKDLDKLIEQLNALPSGFQSRNINPTSVSYNSQSEGYQLNQDGITAYNKWQSSKDTADLEVALEAFKKAADASLRENNLPARANDLSNYGQICRLAGRSEQGMPALEEAIQIHEQQGHVDNLYRDLGNLHASLLDVIQVKQNDGLTEEADQLRARLRPLRQSSANLISRNKGETINPEAHRVEQGEIGLSSDKPIGTDNVNDCVCVVLRDPHTKKTAIAHIDASTGISSLQVLLDRMPDRKPPDKPLEARLIGARFKDDPNEARFRVDNAKQNIRKIVEFLDDRHVDVLSAAILDPSQPTSIVVHPETFEIVEETPGVPNPNMHLGNGKPLITNWGKPLHLSFDLTSSMERAPIILQGSEIMTLRDRYAGKSDDEIYAWFKKNTQYSDGQLPVVVELAVILGEEYKKSVDQVISKLDEKIAALGEKGVTIADFDREKAVKIISEGAIHLGHGAEKANQPLVDFIENKLFSVERGHAYISDLEGLRNFCFPNQPYETIEESVESPSSFQAKLAQRAGNQRREQTNTNVANL